jgi:hypothetical protein
VAAWSDSRPTGMVQVLARVGSFYAFIVLYSSV